MRNINKALAELEKLTLEQLKAKMRALRVDEAGLRTLCKAAFARRKEQDRQERLKAQGLIS